MREILQLWETSFKLIESISLSRISLYQISLRVLGENLQLLVPGDLVWWFR